MKDVNEMEDKLLDVYKLLACHNLEHFFVAFHQTLNINHKRDFILLSRSDLHCIGLTSVSSIKSFENILVSLKGSNEKKEVKNFDYTQFYIDTILPNQEPVIIGGSDITQEDILGTGNFGKVYKGTWIRKTHDGKSVKVPVAIKTLSDGTEMSWRKEVSIFTALNQNHSNIIKFCGLLIGEEDKVQMVTEFAVFGSLLDRLRSKDITSVSTLSQFSVQISSGMVFLHSKNLVHRDLSARNILVTAKNQVKISDFGLSKVLDNQKKEWVMDSTESLPMRWLAPESINNGIFTVSSDVWSFAVVLWEMFTFGDVPWGNLNNEQVKTKIQNGERMPEPQLCPARIYDVMIMCFCQEPQTRPTFQLINKELIERQPVTVVTQESFCDNYDLNFDHGDSVTLIKKLQNNEDIGHFWLGQHETTLLFGRLDIRKTIPVTFSIAYFIEEQTLEEHKDQNITRENQDNSDVMVLKRKLNFDEENKENHLFAPINPPPCDDTWYVNVIPTGKVEDTSDDNNSIGAENYVQKPEEPKIAQPVAIKLPPLEKQIEDIKQKSRPLSVEVLSSRKEFFDLNENSSGHLKSGSESRILFKDTKPDVQDKVNDGIAKNMSAFLTISDRKETASTDDQSTSNFLSPIDVSPCIIKHQTNEKKQLDHILTSVDPYAKIKSASCENVYTDRSDLRMTNTSENDYKRPRPKGKLPFPEETNSPFAYRKSSLDNYAISVKKDFDEFATKVGKQPSTVLTADTSIPFTAAQMKIPTTQISQFQDLKNTQYLAKYNSVIPVTNLQESVQSNWKTTQSSMSSSLHTLNNPTLKKEGSINPRTDQKSPDYYNDFILDQKKLNYFTYDPNAKASTEMSSKEKSRKALSNYKENNWDSFEDCVKNPKKLEKNPSKEPSDISWPTDSSKENPMDNKMEFSAKFQRIRSILPGISVGECLEGLRLSHNDVERAISFIQILKLTRLGYGATFEECNQIYTSLNGNYAKALNKLKIDFIRSKYPLLSEEQAQGTLRVNEWDTTATIKAIFISQCKDIGIYESKALSIFRDFDEDVQKSIEKAKIVRLAEITNQPERVCYKILCHCRWDIEKAINYTLTKNS